jgi:hypothetical protein
VLHCRVAATETDFFGALEKVSQIPQIASDDYVDFQSCGLYRSIAFVFAEGVVLSEDRSNAMCSSAASRVEWGAELYGIFNSLMYSLGL